MGGEGDPAAAPPHPPASRAPPSPEGRGGLGRRRRLSAPPPSLLRPAVGRGLFFQAFQGLRHHLAEHRAQHRRRDQTGAAAFRRRAAARHQELRHDRLLDAGQGLGELGEVLLRQAVLRATIGVDRQLGCLGVGGTDREHLVGLALINAEHAGRNVIAVAHGGTIKAAVGLALGDQPEKGPCLHHRQLLGDAARSSRGRRPFRLANSDGQSALLDRQAVWKVDPASAFQVPKFLNCSFISILDKGGVM